MHRLGFLPEEIPALVEELKRDKTLTPRSVFSHFAGSDSDLFDEYSQMQQECFEAASSALQAGFKILVYPLHIFGIATIPHK
jgi:alanine racemase